MEKHILGIKIQLEKFITEREQMIAANKYREMRDETIAYNEDAFKNLAYSIDGLYYELMKN